MRFRLLFPLLFCTLLLAAAWPATLTAAPAGSLPPRRAAVEAALGWLRAQQDAQGRVGGLGASCEAAWVVAIAGENPSGPVWQQQGGSLLAACAADAPTYLARRDAGRLAKVLRAAVAAGADPRAFAGIDLIAALEAKFDPQTGLYDPTFLYRQTLVILALHEAGRPLSPATRQALLAQQQPDGGWAWAVDPDPGNGFELAADIDATARTLQALRALALPAGHPAYQAGAAFITARQNPDRGWGLAGGATNANSTALAIDGLLAAGHDPESPPLASATGDPVQTLLSLQEASGAFRYRLDAPESRLLAFFDAVPTLVQPFPHDQEDLTAILYLPRIFFR